MPSPKFGRSTIVRQRGTSFGIIAAVLVFSGIWSAREPILRSTAALWIVSDKIVQADAIVVLGGAVDVRPVGAADLYKRGFAPRILIANTKKSTSEDLKDAPAQPELNREVLVKLGVPSSAIVYFGNGLSSTYEETRAFLVWAKSTGAKSVIIPTDIFATRRLRWILSREFGATGIHFSVQAVSPPRYTINDWWLHEEGLVTFRNELIKYLYYRFKYY